METLASVIAAVDPGVWLAAIDLKDAYFHVPIHPESQKYLRFCIAGQAYQYQVLPFGLSTSPRTFTKVLAPVIAHIRMLGVQIFPYLDDILMVAADPQVLSSQVRQAIQVLESAGYVINLAKSSLSPSQDMVYIGAHFQTARDLVCLPMDRAQKISQLVKTYTIGQVFTARQWLVLLGLMTSSLGLTKNARLKMRPVQRYLHSHWRRAEHGLSHLIEVTPGVHAHLQWWTSVDNLLCGLPLSPVPHTVVVTTDASSLGWGAVLEGMIEGERRYGTVQGKWDCWKVAWHINNLELMAVQLALAHFVNTLKSQMVLVRSDNTTTCAYINKQGGTRSWGLCQQAIDLWEWCTTHNIELKAVHVPGVDNVLADYLSRQEVKQTEWSLHQKVVNILFSMWDKPNIDLFASAHNRKLTVFCSMTPSPLAYCKDAFSISWTPFCLGYAFPPQHLLSRVLQKVRQDKARLILIAPFWPTRSWYTNLIQLLVDYPRRLPSWPDLLSQFKVLHNKPQMLKLMAWKISGVSSEVRAFQSKLLTSLPQQELTPQNLLTIQSGEYTSAGVLNGATIPILPL